MEGSERLEIWRSNETRLKEVTGERLGNKGKRRKGSVDG